MPEHHVEAATPVADVTPAAAHDLSALSLQDDSFATSSWSRGAFAQRRLQIGAAADPLEEEADLAADWVMRMPDPPLAQRLCAECEKEEDILRRKPVVPREILAQPKLEVGAADDPLEAEADRVADHVMRMPDRPFAQRRCEECDEEEERVSRTPYALMRKTCGACDQQSAQHEHPPVSFLQRKARADAGDVSDAAAEHISATRGAGAPMPAETQAFMEDRFGADFSGVSIHEGASAADLSSELAAQAFTVGKDVYFNEGKYAPSTSEGQQLLAHELVHVVQQSPDVRRKQSPSSLRRRAAVDYARERSVQRSYFAPSIQVHDRDRGYRIGGTLIHSTVLPMFIRSNTDLFVEVSIPGSSKDFAEPGEVGVADFYKALPTEGQARTIGLKFPDEPLNLRRNNRLQFGGDPNYDHNKQSAPKGERRTPRARRMSRAPGFIELGDLKPGGGAEALLGPGQVNRYAQGIRTTAHDLNNYLAVNPNETDGATSWHPTVTMIPLLTIPPRLVYPSGQGLARGRLHVYEGFGQGIDSGLEGSMYVYKDDLAGIWSYEWIPNPIPASTGSAEVNRVLDRLNTQVIPPLITPGVTQIASKRITTAAARPVVRRKDEKFDDAKWKSTHYAPWKKDADAVLGNKGEVEKAKVAEALVDLKKRNSDVAVPIEVQEGGKGLGKVRHWTRFGGIFGWLREKFDFIFVKVHAFAKSIKDKVKKIARKVGSTSFGSWLKAAVQVVFKIFKIVGAWVVGEVLDKLVNSLSTGIMNNVRKVIDMITPDDVKAKIQEFEDLKEKYREIIEEQEDALIKRFFGDKLEFFEKLEKFEAIASTLSTIASIVEWGVRLLACASPPALGCLWNLVMSALEYAFARLMQTCWFTKKVYEPVISNVDLVRKFPAEVAAKIVEVGNEYIPVPAGFDPLFAPISVDMGTFSVDCNSGGDGADELTPERKAIMDLIDAIGPDKFYAWVELGLKRGAGPWVLMTVERANSLRDLLQAVSAEDLRAAAKNPSQGLPQSLDDFLKTLETYSPGEKKLIAEAAAERKRRAEQKAEAEARARASGGGTGGGTVATGSGGGTGGGKGGGKGGGIAYEVIKGPTGLDASKMAPSGFDVKEVVLTVKQQDARSGTVCDARLVLNDQGRIVTIPLAKVRIDMKTRELSSGEPDSLLYWISLVEEIHIKYSTGEVLIVQEFQMWESDIKFSSA